MKLLKGSRFEDSRGIITYNNDFDAEAIRRIYTIENADVDFVRGWQGHRIEQRWFAAVKGEFKISVMIIDDFDKPSSNLKSEVFILNDMELSWLHVPAGCITAIQSMKKDSRLLVLADYQLGEIKDEYRFPINYFKEN